MSNNEYEHQTFCQQVKMKKSKIKISFTTFPGLCIGIGFPWTDYSDMYITILFIGIHFKWRKR